MRGRKILGLLENKKNQRRREFENCKRPRPGCGFSKNESEDNLGLALEQKDRKSVV